MTQSAAPRLALLTVAAATSAATSAVSGGGFTFVPQPPVTFPNVHFPTHLAGHDLNHDGNLDVVVAGRDTMGLAFVLFGVGDGTFQVPVALDLGGQTDWVELGDVNGDGETDIAFAHRSAPSGLMILLGSASGAFGRPQLFPGGREIRGIAVRDFDGDGDLDAVGIDYSGFQLVTWANNGTGTFSISGAYRVNDEFFGLANPNSVVAGDLDNDGDQDLVVTALGAGRIDVMRNNGFGQFAPEVGHRPPQTSGVQPAVTNSAVGDVDGDGDLDIVTPWIMGFTGQRLGLLVNSTVGGTPGTFGSNPSFPSLFQGISWWPALADLDGDGDLDVAVGYGLPGPVGLLMNLSTPGSPFFVQLQSLDIGQFVRSILPADVDNDGDQDLIVVEAPANQLIVLRNDTPQGGIAGEGNGTPEGAAGPPPPGRDGKAPPLPPLPPIDSNRDGVLDAFDLAAWMAGLTPGSSAFHAAPEGGAR